MNAVLIKLSISQFGNERKDRAMTEEMREAKAIGKGGGKWTKFKILPGGNEKGESFTDEEWDVYGVPVENRVTLKQVASEFNRIRTISDSFTLAWEDGVRLLMVNMRDRWQQAVEAQEAIAYGLLNKFASGGSYAAHIKHARDVVHKERFYCRDYPGASDVPPHDLENPQAFVREYRVSRDPRPYPHGSHYDQSVRELFAEETELANQTRVKAMAEQLWDRLLDPVKKMADTLAGDGNRWHETLVTNVRDMVEVVPGFVEGGITGGEKLMEAVAAIQAQLTAASAEELKSQPMLRKAQAQAAADLHNKFANMGSGRVLSRNQEAK